MNILVNYQNAKYFIDKIELPDQNYMLYFVYSCILLDYELGMFFCIILLS